MGKKRKKIRPLAVAVIWREDAILVAEGYDSVKQERFFRPLGGSIEFGEYGQQTVVRELQEEIEAEIGGVHYLGLFENIFRYEGKKLHEIFLVYEAVFLDAAMYQRELIEGYDDHQTLFRASWKPLRFFQQAEAPLYPSGLLDLLVASH